MAKKKPRRNKRNDSETSHENDDAQPNPESSRTTDSRKNKPEFLPPDPPKPRPVIFIVSGILMISWMIFLLVVAVSG